MTITQSGLGKARDVYDAMGNDYLSPKHRTVMAFNEVQAGPIFRAIKNKCSGLGLDFADVDLLNVGVGNGQHWLDNRIDRSAFSYRPQHLHGDYSFGDSVLLPKIDEKKITFSSNRWIEIDISPNMLQAARENYAMENNPELPIQVLGDATEMKKAFGPTRFDIVLGALCDHLYPNSFLGEAHYVLRPTGVLIVTYPHKQLMDIIRGKIYDIPLDKTRYELEGQSVLINSHSQTPETLESLFKEAGFETVEISELYLGNVAPSNTIEKALRISGKTKKELPILVKGVGRKPDTCSEKEKLIDRDRVDPWWFYN